MPGLEVNVVLLVDGKHKHGSLQATKYGLLF